AATGSRGVGASSPAARPGPSQPPLVDPSSPAAAVPSTNAAAGSNTSPSSAAQGDGPAQRDDRAQAAAVAAAGALGTGLLAPPLASRLPRARRRQQQHRRPQRRLPHPQAGSTETALLAAARPLDVERLDTALRALAADLVDRPAGQLPDPLAAHVT